MARYKYIGKEGIEVPALESMVGKDLEIGEIFDFTPTGFNQKRRFHALVTSGIMEIYVEPVKAPKRARNEKGHLKADDISTPDVNEAWEGGKAPKKKAAPKKKVAKKKITKKSTAKKKTTKKAKKK